MCCVLIDIHVFSFACFSQKVFSLFLFRSFASRFFCLHACAPGPAANLNLLMQQHTYALTFLSRNPSHSHYRLSLDATTRRLQDYVSRTLARSHYAQFFTCFLSFFFLCVSSFIDYLNVTTKLDISTSNNKLGFVFFFFLMCVCGFPFILNISLFFKRLKMRRFPSFAIFS